MFEPENDIERQLVRAATEPAARAAFARALMDAEVYLVLVPESGTIVPDADGNATVPKDAKLALVTVERDGSRVLPFFSAPSRARAWFAGDHFIAPDKTRDLFARHPGADFVLNPGSDYGKEFTPHEVERLLAGEFDGGPQRVVTDQPSQLLLGHPKEKPEALIAALTRELAGVKSVRGAWLMLAVPAEQPEQHWMLGVDHTGDWAEVDAAIGRAVADGVLQGRPLDVVPLDRSSLADTLRTGIPIVPVQRRPFGFFR
jgi:hypothetical protein